MEPTPELVDEIYREKILRAQQMTGEEKLLAGPRLFEYACRIAMDGIRNEHPGADEATVREILRQRLRWRKEQEERELEHRRRSARGD